MLKNYPPLALYMSIVSLSTVLASATDTWILTWIALEVSLIGFIPIFSIDENITGQALSSYFLIQASGSAIYIVSNLLTIDPAGMLVIQLSLAINLGLFPFHQWVPLCVNSITWEGSALLLTLQNGPVLIVIYTSEEDLSDLQTIAIISIGPTAITAYNQVTLRNLIAYSSIIHSSWLLLAILDSSEVAVLYTLYYFGITYFTFLSFICIEEQINNNNDITFLAQQQATLLLILAGIPPFSIFILNIAILINIPDLWNVAYILVSTFIAGYYYFSVITPNIILIIFTRENRILTLGLLFNSSPALLVFF